MSAALEIVNAILAPLLAPLVDAANAAGELTTASLADQLAAAANAQASQRLPYHAHIVGRSPCFLCLR